MFAPNESPVLLDGVGVCQDVLFGGEAETAIERGGSNLEKGGAQCLEEGTNGMCLRYHFCLSDVCLVLLKLAQKHAGCCLLLSVWYC